MALAQFEEYKLSQPTSHAQVQITERKYSGSFISPNVEKIKQIWEVI